MTKIHKFKHIDNSDGRLNGISSTKGYFIWFRIVERCENKKNTAWKYYGERGIKMCKEWRNDPLKFIEWYDKNMPENSKGLSVDRIDVNGDYSPENCRIADAKTQGRNKRNNIKVEGVTSGEFSEKTGMKYTHVHLLMKAGDSLEEIKAKGEELKKIERGEFGKSVKELAKILNKSYVATSRLVSKRRFPCHATPIYKRIYFTDEDIKKIQENNLGSWNRYEGKTIWEWVKETGICYTYIAKNLKKGWSIRKIIETNKTATRPFKRKKSQSE